MSSSSRVVPYSGGGVPVDSSAQTFPMAPVSNAIAIAPISNAIDSNGSLISNATASNSGPQGPPASRKTQRVLFYLFAFCILPPAIIMIYLFTFATPESMYDSERFSTLFACLSVALIGAEALHVSVVRFSRLWWILFGCVCAAFCISASLLPLPGIISATSDDLAIPQPAVLVAGSAICQPRPTYPALEPAPAAYFAAPHSNTSESAIRNIFESEEEMFIAVSNFAKEILRVGKQYGNILGVVMMGKYEQRCPELIVEYLSDVFLIPCNATCAPVQPCRNLCTTLIKACGVPWPNMATTYVEGVLPKDLHKEFSDYFFDLLSPTGHCMSPPKAEPCSGKGSSFQLLGEGACDANATARLREKNAVNMASWEQQEKKRFGRLTATADLEAGQQRTFWLVLLLTAGIPMLLTVGSVAWMVLIGQGESPTWWRADQTVQQLGCVAVGFGQLALASVMFYLAMLVGEAGQMVLQLALHVFSLCGGVLFARSVAPVIPKPDESSDEEKQGWAFLRRCKEIKTKFSVNGTHGFILLVFTEAFEIVVQTANLFDVAPFSSTDIILALSIGIGVNCIVAGLLFMHPSVLLHKDANMIVDSCLDIYFIFVGLFARREQISLEGLDTMGALSLLIPCIRRSQGLWNLQKHITSIQLGTFTMRQVTTTLRRQGTLTSSSANLQTPGPDQADPDRDPVQVQMCGHWMGKLTCVLIVLLGAVLLASTAIRVEEGYAACRAELGLLWDHLPQHLLFTDGLHAAPTCGYHIHTALNITGAALTVLPAALGKFSALEVLSVTAAAQISPQGIPTELGHLPRLRSLVVSGVVNEHFDWSNRGLGNDGASAMGLFRFFPTVKVLNLSQNRLNSVPEEIRTYLPDLQDVDLSDNNLTSLHDVKFSNLQILRVARNRLYELPASHRVISRSLREADFQANKITFLDSGFLYLESVQFKGNPVSNLELNGASVKLPKLVEMLGDFGAHLKALNLSWNGFDQEVCGSSNFSKSLLSDSLPLGLNVLDVSGTCNLPWDFGRLRSLRILRVEGSNVTSVGDLSQLTELTYLNLFQNRLSFIGDLSKMKLLKSLDLSRNNFKGTLPGLADCTALTELRLAWNQLSGVDLSNLTALVFVKIAHNHISTLGDFTRLKALQVLDLAYQGEHLTAVHGISHLTALIDLQVEANNLSELDLGDGLPHLLTLLAWNNKLSKLIGLTKAGTPNLRVIVLWENGLTNAAVTNLLKMNTLVRLDLGANKLTGELDVSSLSNLHDLDLSKNNLTALNLSHMTGLMQLGLQGNSLTTLGTITQNTRLQFIDVSGNYLTSVGDLSALADLEVVHLDNNGPHRNITLPRTG